MATIIAQVTKGHFPDNKCESLAGLPKLQLVFRVFVKLYVSPKTIL